MTKAELILKIKSMKWEKWLERPFFAFLLSLFEDASKKECFEKINIPDVQDLDQFFQNHYWYMYNGIFDAMDTKIERYLEKHTIFDVTTTLEEFKQRSEAKIKQLISAQIPTEQKFSEVYEILKLCCTFIWLAHGLESFYQKKLNTDVPKYIKTDVDKFIGDASFPVKQNEHAKLEEMMRSDATDEEIANTFGWLKSRDGFSDIFSPEEIAQMRKELKPVEKPPEVKIPEPLKTLFDQMQELVYFRTARTDVFYFLFYTARPILKDLAKQLDIPYEELKYYRAKSLIEGKKEKYSPEVTFAYLYDQVIFQDEPILEDISVAQTQEFKGMVACSGKVKGIVKVVKDVNELDKVKDGDILVTQMTFPSFIPAMNRAIAFVTDEGGLTCHAAIIARELQKPCIIGTKIATKVLHDGDIIEVDANKGIVTIIKRVK